MPELTRPIKVLHVQRHLVMGGLQNVILGLLRHMDRDLVENAVCCVMEGGFSEEEFRRTGVPVVVLGMPVWNLPMAPFALAKVIRESKPDILHVHLPWLEIVAVLAARLAGGAKIVCHEHARVGSTVIPPWLQGHFARRADRIIGVSESIAGGVRSLLGVPADRVFTIHNAVDLGAVDTAPAVDLRAELGLPSRSILIGYAGRLVALKDVGSFIEATSRVRAAHPDVHLVLIGDGPLKRSLQEQATRLGMMDAVHFLGQRRDVFGLMKALDLYVNPAVTEGLGLSIVEAMAAGIPVVATAVDGVPEVVVHGETGYLVPPRDSTALAEAIMRALADPVGTLSMGQAGRRQAEKQFTFASAIPKVEAIYRELMDAAVKEPSRR